MNNQKGLTLIEILVVIGLLAIIAGSFSFINLDSWRASIFRGERNLLVSVLQRARSQSINNVCLGGGCTDGQPHGVAIQADKYIIFQGPSFAARKTAVDEIISANTLVSHAGLTEIVFEQLSGNASPAGNITLKDIVRTAAISVNEEGAINW